MTRLRQGVAFWLAGALAVAVIGLVWDGAALLAGGASLRQAAAAGLVAASTGALLSLAAAPIVTAAVSARGRLRWIAIFGLAALAGWLIASSVPERVALNAIATALFAAGVTAVAWMRRSRTAGAIALAIGLLADAAVGAEHYRELHDLAWLFAMCGAIVTLAPLRARIVAARGKTLLGVAAAAAVAPSLILMTVDAWAPGWRGAATFEGRQARRVLAFARAAIDFDRDGTSPIAWGGDCDDWDAEVHPLAADPPGGGDTNCNGVDPPARPTDAQLGLAPPYGSPSLAGGGPRLVVLVTIDSLRADALTAERMPRLDAWAARAVRFERLYAAGSRTRLALPAIFAGRLPLALREAGVSTTALLGLHDPTLAELRVGFERVESRHDLHAPALTDLALADVAAHAGGRHFLWVHYDDAHDYRSRDEYHARVASIDRELARLLAALPESSVVIVTADHGEAFGEYGVTFHGTSTIEPLLRVPGLVAAPGLAARTHRSLASHHDVPPTIRGAFGLEAAERAGRSWLRLRDGDAPLHTFVVSRSARFASGDRTQVPMAAIVEGWSKLSLSFEDGLVELVDLSTEGVEDRDLAAALPEEAERLRAELALWHDLVR
jgi:hypothetical protein